MTIIRVSIIELCIIERVNERGCLLKAMYIIRVSIKEVVCYRGCLLGALHYKGVY